MNLIADSLERVALGPTHPDQAGIVT